MFKEKRRYPRLTKSLPLKITSRDFDIVTQTKNVSCIGAYCSVSTRITPMTKLKITLLLSERKNSSQQTSKKVECMGVVVRAEENTPNLYNIAIFFEQIKEKEREKLEDYIQRHLSS